MHKPTSDCRATERNRPWPMVRLGDVCEVVLGGTPKTGIPKYWDGDIPWLTPGDMGKITQMYVDASNCKRKITQLGLDSGSTLCPARSVILSTRAPIGYAFVNSVPMATNQGCKTLVPSDDVYPEYLCFNLLGRTDELNELGTGTTFKELATSNLKAMTFPLPSLSVQREIVARLERELAAVEKMKKGFETLAETAKAEFKAELKEVFEEISRGGAETRRLGEVCEMISSRGHQIKQSEILPEGKYPVVSQSENEIEGFSNKEICIADVPVILFGDHTCNVKLVNKPFVVGADGTKLIKSIMHCVQFLYYCLKLLGLKLQDGKYRRHFGDLCGSEIPLPPLAVQREVVARLDSAKARAEKLEAKAREGVTVCETMRKAILKEAFE